LKKDLSDPSDKLGNPLNSFPELFLYLDLFSWDAILLKQTIVSIYQGEI